MMDLDQIPRMIAVVKAAVQWVKYRDLARKLSGERGQIFCKSEFDEDGLIDPAPKPCWKKTRRVSLEDFEHIPREEWCASCLKRQEVHERYSQAAASRGAYQRALIAAVRRLEGAGQ